MGDLIPFPSNMGDQLNNITEQLPSDAAALLRESRRAIRAAETLLADIITINPDTTGPDFAEPA